MARARNTSNDKRRPPARTPEARELELSSAAYDLAEEQIQNGTASSQVITHFLKAGSMRERLEQVKISHEIELMEVKKEQLVAEARRDEQFAEAIAAMRSYQGVDSTGEYELDDR